MTIYSATLAHVHVADGDLLTAYTVPSGITVVVRDMTLKVISGSTATVVISVNSGSVNCGIWAVRLTDGLLTVQWQGREVLKAGDTLQVASVEGYFSFRASGYELGG